MASERTEVKNEVKSEIKSEVKTLQEKKLVKISGDYCGMSKIVLTREIK